MTHKYPALHNAMWPGLVGKGSAGAEPSIDLDTMLDLTSKAEVNGTTVTPDSSGTNELSAIIPALQIPRDGNFNYSVSAEVATAGPLTGEVVYCITATGRAGSGLPGGLVLFSSTATKAAGWDSHLNRYPFVNGNTTLTGVNAGGYCAATGAAQATCTSC